MRSFFLFVGLPRAKALAMTDLMSSALSENTESAFFAFK